MRFFILILFISACASREPTVITKEVQVPVPVPCLKGADVPEARKLKSDELVKKDSIFRKTQALLIDVKGLKSENSTLRALVVGCVED